MKSVSPLIKEIDMKNFIVLFTNQNEWGMQNIDAETPLKALEAICGETLEIDISPEGKFLHEDDTHYFTGIIIPSEKLKEYVYVYRHDSETLVGYSNPLECYKALVKELGKNYGLEEALDVVDFLVESIDNVLNIHLESWGDTTIFIMD